MRAGKLLLASFSAKFLVFFMGLVSEENQRREVGRVVSLSIDLQDISELDRDAVIASCRGKKKDCLCPRELHYVYSKVSSHKYK